MVEFYTQILMQTFDEKAAQALLRQLSRRWQQLKIAETTCIALSVALWGAWLLYFFSPLPVWMAVACGLLLGVAGGFIWLWRNPLQRYNLAKLSSHLNQQQTWLEDSAELLWAAPEGLSSVALLQKQVLLHRLPAQHHTLQVPHRLPAKLGLLAASLTLVWLLLPFGKFQILGGKRAVGQSSANATTQSSKKAVVLPAGVKTATAFVSPPTYTQIGAYQTPQLNLKFPEGSQISWQFTFEGEIQRALLVLSEKDSLPLVRQPNGVFATQATLKNAGYYVLFFIDKQGNRTTSDYFSWEAKADQKPKITLRNIEQFTDLQFNPHLVVEVNAQLQDDYGLTDAYLVATVSKGSGEAVKFREEKMYFDQSLSSGTTTANLSKSFKLSALGMTPGDELYFYVEAIDNRQPNPQKGRTDVYFIALADTAQLTATMQLGSGINQMPEYFRSQRQLIIDTEKLIAEKNGLATDQFQSRSNDIGVDQKILRLRYGQFLGEEFESNIGGSHHHHDHEGEDHDEEEEHFEGDGHGHEDSGHQKWMQERSSMKTLEKNEHGHSENPNKKKTSSLYSTVPESVMHIHDSQEEASFLDETLKAELRVVLTQMWEAELRLRTARPEESLPFQYKALYLLKDIQQKSRVYVERVGFDPPPLDEKKRLSGDVTKLKNASGQRRYEVEALYPQLKKMLAYLDQCDAAAQVPTLDKALLQAGGLELAAFTLENPTSGYNLKALQLLKNLQDAPSTSGESLRPLVRQLRQLLWKIFPNETQQPKQAAHSVFDLQKMYLQKIGI